MRSAFERLLPLLVLPLALAACEDSSFDPSNGDAGTMSIMLTDAPGDFEHAVVTIERIELLGEDEDLENGRIVLRDGPVTVDLLELQNEVMILVGETPVPGGSYSELRLIISEGLITVEQEDGSLRAYASSTDFADAVADDLGLEFTSVGDLQMPSFGQSGLKIKLPSSEALVDGDDNAVLIDFNVAQSFGHQAGNSGKWVLHPVIHATGFSSTGSLQLNLVLGEGVTLPMIGEIQVTPAMLSALLDRNGDLIPVAFTDADADGTWQATFRFLPPGDWTVDIGALDAALAALNLTTDPELPLTFSVASGQTVTRTVTITAAGVDE
jgi:hypothetical protein